MNRPRPSERLLFAVGLGIGLALLVVPGLIFFARYILVGLLVLLGGPWPLRTR